MCGVCRPGELYMESAWSIEDSLCPHCCFLSQALEWGFPLGSCTKHPGHQASSPGDGIVPLTMAQSSEGSPPRSEHPAYLIAEAMASYPVLDPLDPCSLCPHCRPCPGATFLFPLQRLCQMLSWAASCVCFSLPCFPICRFPSPGPFPFLLAAHAMLYYPVLTSGRLQC